MQHYLVIFPIQVHIHLGLRRCSHLGRDIKLKEFNFLYERHKLGGLGADNGIERRTLYVSTLQCIVARGHLAKLTVEVMFIGNNAAQGSGRLRWCRSRCGLVLLVGGWGALPSPGGCVEATCFSTRQP